MQLHILSVTLRITMSSPAYRATLLYIYLSNFLAAGAACHGVLWVLAVRNSVFPVTI